ncbi:MAG: OmpA family [Actinomycetota bacterium]
MLAVAVIDFECTKTCLEKSVTILRAMLLGFSFKVWVYSTNTFLELLETRNYMRIKITAATLAVLTSLSTGVVQATEYSFPTGMNVSVERDTVPSFKEDSNVVYKVNNYFNVIMPNGDAQFVLKNEEGDLLPVAKEGDRYFVGANIAVGNVIYWGPDAESAADPVRVMIQGPINIGHIHFASASAKLSTVGKKALRLMAKEMANSNLTSAYLVGMTDRAGGNDANLSLSAKRAEAAAAYLEKKLDLLGIKNAVIRTESMGEYLSSKVDGTVNEFDRKVSVLIYPTV